MKGERTMKSEKNKNVSTLDDGWFDMLERWEREALEEAEKEAEREKEEK